MCLTPEILKEIVQARLVQTFRQYPLASLHLSTSCRDRLLEATKIRLLAPKPLRAFIQPELTTWTLQARLAFDDIFKYYEGAFQAGNDSENVSLLRAISDGILSATGISLQP